MRASKLYNEARFNEGTKHGMIMEAIQSDQSLLQFVLLRKANTFEEVKETCLEYAEHQKVYSLTKKVTGSSSGVLDVRMRNKQQKINELSLDKTDMLCKKFDDLALLIAKSKPK